MISDDANDHIRSLSTLIASISSTHNSATAYRSNTTGFPLPTNAGNIMLRPVRYMVSSAPISATGPQQQQVSSFRLRYIIFLRIYFRQFVER